MEDARAEERKRLMDEAEYWFRHATELHGALSRVWVAAKYYDAATIDPSMLVTRVERAENALQRIRKIVADAITVGRG